MRYTVPLEARYTIEVEAENPEEAAARAEQLVADYRFDVGNGEYISVEVLDADADVEQVEKAR